MASRDERSYPRGTISAIMEEQYLFQAILAHGNLSTEEEINLRRTFAELLIQEYEARGNVLYIRTAIEHYEAILRRLPQNSPTRPKHLTRLSYAWLSEYMATEPRRALDEAVRTGRLARERAILASLDKSDVKLYCEILNNCGVALSYRSEYTHAAAARTGSTVRQSCELDGGRAEADVDEAIDCAKSLKDYAAKNSPNYAMAISNLSSRLMMRYAMSGNEADQEEAVELVQELQTISQPGSIESAGAITLLSQLAVDKFNKNDTLENLDRALGQLKESIASLPELYERKPDVYSQTSSLYRRRYQKTKDAADLHLAVQYSKLLLHTVPVSHAVMDTYLFDHLRLLREYVNAVDPTPQVEQAVLTAGQYVANLRRNGTKQLDCRLLYGDILGRAYILSRRLEDFVKAMNHIEQLGYDYNSHTEQSGDTAPVDTQLLYSIAVDARNLLRASPGQTRDRGIQKLYEQIHRQCQSANFINDLLRTDIQFLELLRVYANATQAGESITDSQANIRADEAHAKKQRELQQRLSRPRWKPTDYKTELGMRRLATDPTNRRIVMDLSTLMEDIFGYDPDKPITTEAEFVARQKQIEADSIAKAKAKGQHPNPKLCYMCRYIKILKPTTVDTSTSSRSRPKFEWNDKLWLPFGNWNQLRQRTNCSICKLILSLIVTDQARTNLHPRLAMIDPEIQGTQLRPVQLSNGEMALQVEYGMRPVGEIRVVSHSNYSQALRQGWEDGGYLQPAHGKMPVYQAETLQSLDVMLPRKDSNQQIDVNTLKVWLKDCDNNHGETCNRGFHESAVNALSVDDVPLILIDVERWCLVESTSVEKYFALSYVWGKVDMLPTLVANFEARQKPGGLNGLPFPRTISDAIELVRAFGEIYIWIDALCIVQDHKTQKTRDIANMNVVYSKAFATIIAMHGANADAGLPGVKPKTRPPQKVETLIIKAGSEDLDYDPEENEGTDNTDSVAINLVATSPALHLALEASWWDSRGWTFQERLLSRRCLCFSEHYVYFQCGQRDRVLSECGINERILNETEDDGSRPKAPITTTLDNPLSDLGLSLVDLPAESERVVTFKAYSSLVEKYTRRQLTYDSDIINAFMGTFKALESFQGQVLCGLPLPTLDLALLWTPRGRVPRRGHDLNTRPAQAREEGRPVLNQLLPTNRGTVLEVYGPSSDPSFDKSVDRRFPSWSWVGWKGSVEYRFFADAFTKEPHPTPLISKYATNLDGTQLLIIKDRVQERRIVTPESQTSAAPETSSANPILSKSSVLVAELGAVNISGSQEQDIKWSLAPTLPNVLQFQAPAVPLTAFTISQNYEYISLADQIHASTRQAVRHILDRNGKRCGLWWEQTGYVYVGRGVSPEAEKKMLLVGISRHEDTFKSREGPKRVEGEIRLFDDVYLAVGKRSGLVNVIAVDTDMGHDYMERITAARIHVKAWEDARPEMKMIMLA
jgi:Heterokaryon incompatibility protein (HET)